MRKVESLISDCLECPYTYKDEKEDKYLKCVHPKTDKNKIHKIDLFNHNFPLFCPLEKYKVDLKNCISPLCFECAYLWFTIYGEYCTHSRHDFRETNFPKICPYDCDKK